MSEKDVIQFSNRTVVPAAKDLSLKRARSFKVTTNPADFTQYATTVRAYALAGMPFDHIASAGDFLGDKVERQEIDAALQNNGEGMIGEVAEDASQILAWQTRGERISVVHQLAAPTTGNELVVVSEELVTTEGTKEKTIEVLEGIKVLSKEHEGELENNPYLKFQPQEIKKAA